MTEYMTQKEQKIFLIQFAVVITLVIVFIILVFIFIELKKQGTECMASPLEYYNSLGKDECRVTCLGGLVIDKEGVHLETKSLGGTEEGNQEYFRESLKKLNITS